MKQECSDCEPRGHMEFNGQTYPTYISLCEQCSRDSMYFEAGRRYEYDKIHGKGSFDIEQEKGDAYT